MIFRVLHKRLAPNQTGKGRNNASVYGNRASRWSCPPTGDPKYLMWMFSGTEPPK